MVFLYAEHANTFVPDSFIPVVKMVTNTPAVSPADGVVDTQLSKLADIPDILCSF